MKSTLTKSQTQKHVKHYTEDGKQKTIVCDIRYDDQCGNGHNTFSVTGVVLDGTFKTDVGVHDGRWEQCGCIHEDIRKHFPEFGPLIKWHLVSSDGPMHYVSNTLYHASDKDCNGLRKGETRQLINGKSKLPSWMPVVYDEEGKECHVRSFPYLDAKERPPKDGDVTYVPWVRIGQGSEPDLEAARSSAAWPDATLGQLQDKDALAARLPALLASFKSDIKSLGFVY